MYGDFCDAYSPIAEKEKELKNDMLISTYSVICVELEKIKNNNGWYNEDVDRINVLTNAFRVVQDYLGNKLNSK